MNADIEKIAVLTRKYESNGDPAYISSGVGDVGGVSYGLYQFASKLGIVDAFVDWLKNYPVEALANYGRALATHKVNSNEFKNRWHDNRFNRSFQFRTASRRIHQTSIS